MNNPAFANDSPHYRKGNTNQFIHISTYFYSNLN